MSNDNETKFFQILMTVSRNQDNLANLVKTLIETNTSSISNLSGQMNEFKSEAHNKIEKVNKEIYDIRSEIRQTIDNIMLAKIDEDNKFKDQNDRIEQLETVFGEISVKICDENVREDCKNWSENSGTINKYIQKDKNYQITKKTIKERFKNNIIDTITSPGKWPSIIVFLSLITGFIYGIIKFVQEYISKGHTLTP